MVIFEPTKSKFIKAIVTTPLKEKRGKKKKKKEKKRKKVFSLMLW